MTGFLLLIALPVAVSASLALLPAGRPAVIGLSVAAAALAPVLRSAGGGRGGPPGAVGVGAVRGGAVGLAARAQGLRSGAAAPGWPVGDPPIAGLVGAGAVIALFLPIGAV
jgi:hypothetical protein